MEKKIVEYTFENGDINFGFVGFEDWTDFVNIIKIVENKIIPEKVNYQGITDMNGYFEKDGLYVEIRYNSMIGNDLVFKGDKTDENLNKIKEWAKIIFDNLMTSVEG